MHDIDNLIEKMGLENRISLEDIPGIDLYMDQVIQLFEKKYNSSKRNDDEKVLTKTMINNYAKGKVFLPIKNKKYSKEHIILISLIYQLKGALSINEIKETLNVLNERTVEKSIDLEQFYHSYLHLVDENISSFKENFSAIFRNVKEEETTEDLEYILLVASLVNMSNFYRRAAEKLVDDMATDVKGKE